jgi:hypothetical protein
MKKSIKIFVILLAAGKVASSRAEKSNAMQKGTLQ